MVFAPLVQADLSDFKVATWNLQGSSARTENKWNINVRQLISGAGAVNILATQEAGSPRQQHGIPDVLLPQASLFVS